ncbi:MAG: hypothetical protein ACAF41_21560 [Leptolyngbya sp. BL-A-14]
MGTLTITVLKPLAMVVMPNRSRSLLVSPHEAPASSAKPADLPPFAWETVHQTVLQFVNPLACQPLIASPVLSDNLLAPMQRLVAMIETLRSSPLAPLENASGTMADDLQRLETLSPYVSEEAYDVLDALREEKRLETTGESTVREPSQMPLSCPPPAAQTLITIDALIPSLLWSLARSSYSTMHLIEGIRSTCSRTGDDWASGMLRLVVMLEAETPTVRWAFDLATGYPAENLLEPTAIVQSDEFALPIRCVSTNNDSLCQVQHQLQALLRSLQTDVPGLKPLLHGIPVDLLQPGTAWQTGLLRLRFGFTFSAQALNASSGEGAYWHPELIEAELMDESIGLRPNNASQGSVTAAYGMTDRLSKTQVSVVNPFGRSLRSTTLVRVIDADPLEPYIQSLRQQQLEQGLLHLQRQSLADDEEAQLALIVQTAIASCDHPNASGMNLLQPMLLMDELVPKLLWSLTSSTYEIMQLVGGVPAQVLQPGTNWQQGTLRLLAALHLKATDVDYCIDLSTGRSLPVDRTALDSSTIVQTNALASPQPTSIGALTAYLQEQLDAAVAEYRLLNKGISIVWLEDVEQDWQSGTMELSVSLAFVPD